MEPTVHCPQCGYDLRGIPDGRCPECNYQYSTDAVRQLAGADAECVEVKYQSVTDWAVWATGAALIGLMAEHLGSIDTSTFAGRQMFRAVIVVGSVLAGGGVAVYDLSRGETRSLRRVYAIAFLMMLSWIVGLFVSLLVKVGATGLLAMAWFTLREGPWTDLPALGESWTAEASADVRRARIRAWIALVAAHAAVVAAFLL